MSAKIEPIRKREPEVQSKNNFIDKNLSYAYKWYKKKVWPEGMKIRKGSSGSAVSGVVKNSYIEIYYSPPFATKLAPNTRIIETNKRCDEFEWDLEEAYKDVLEWSKCENERLCAVDLKQSILWHLNGL